MAVKPQSWPVVPGSYIVGDPKAPVAVCALTSESLMSLLARIPGVAISGMVYTANLGITRIIQNITSNPSIRFLLICGKDSRLFKPGQSIVSLSERGVDNEKRIVGASGYQPLLQALTLDQISVFRRQVEVIDWSGEEDLETLEERIRELAARNPGRYMDEGTSNVSPLETFETIRPGGQREPLVYDPKGYFVISLDRGSGEILLRHYLPDHRPAHEMRGRGATSILLGLIREGLVSQLSHAGYLGEELAKAQIALQLGLRYDQDRPLREVDVINKTQSESSSSFNEPSASAAPREQQVKPTNIEPLTLAEFEGRLSGSKVDLVLSVNSTQNHRTLNGELLNMDQAEPFTTYRRTLREVTVNWTEESRIIMGGENEIQVGALIRIVGTLEKSGATRADQIVILTKVARILP